METNLYKDVPQAGHSLYFNAWHANNAALEKPPWLAIPVGSESTFQNNFPDQKQSSWMYATSLFHKRKHDPDL